MNKNQYREAIANLNLTQEGAGIFFGYSERTGQRWAAGHHIPFAVQGLILMMLEHDTMPDDLLSGSYGRGKRHPRPVLKEERP